MFRGKLKKYLQNAFGLILIIFLLSACQAVSVGYIGQDRNARWDEDLRYLKKELPERHKNLFFKTGKAEFEQRLEELRKAVPDMEDTKVALSIKKIVATMGDAHTDVAFRPSRICPVALYWFKEGIYVINTSEDNKNIIYKEVIKINGHDVNMVSEALAAIIPYENDQQLIQMIPRYMIAPEILAGLGMGEGTDSIIFTVKGWDGVEEAVEITSQDINNQFVLAFQDENQEMLPLYRRNSQLNYWYEYLEDEKLLYFKYNRCRDMEGKTVRDISADILEEIDAGKVEKLVIDMRNNGGGSSPLLDPFIDELSKRSINSGNRIFVIVGRQTFSSAVLNAISMKNRTQAVFLGEPTGGRPNHYGEVKSFKLPNSGLEVSYSTKYFTHSKEDTDSFYPDRIIELTVQDYMDGRDSVLETIVDEY